MHRRVVITGMGIISPCGNSKEAFWESMTKGIGGIDRITRFNASQFPSQMAGEVKDFDASRFLNPKQVKRSFLFSQYAVAAAKMAIEDAGLDLADGDPHRVGTFLGRPCRGWILLRPSTKFFLIKV